MTIVEIQHILSPFCPASEFHTLTTVLLQIWRGLTQTGVLAVPAVLPLSCPLYPVVIVHAPVRSKSVARPIIQGTRHNAAQAYLLSLFKVLVRFFHFGHKVFKPQLLAH